MKKIGFIGLGIMGGNMASHLLKKYKNINIIKRNSINTKKFIKKFANKGKINLYNNPKELAENSELIISCVGNDNDLEDIYLRKNKILDGVKKNTIIVDHTTASLNISIKLFKKFRSKQVFFFDAPVSGGEVGAQKGNLAIMVGGKENIFTQCKPIFEVLGSSVVLCGNYGAGNTTKLANQIIVAANIEAVSEALVLAKKAGLDPNTVFNAIKGGLAGSTVLNAKAPMMITGDFNPGFRIKLHQKDLHNALLTGKELGVPLPVTSLIQQMIGSLMNKGKGDLDHSAIANFLEDLAQIEI